VSLERFLRSAEDKGPPEDAHDQPASRAHSAQFPAAAFVVEYTASESWAFMVRSSDLIFSATLALGGDAPSYEQSAAHSALEREHLDRMNSRISAKCFGSQA